MELLQRPLAITDIETTGLDAQIHEIIEIGLIVVNQRTLRVLDKFESRVSPTYIETAIPKALEINGYNEKDWENTPTLKEVMKTYAKKTESAIFLAHNITHDWSFIQEAFKKTEVENLMDYHRIDLLTLAWSKVSKLPNLTKLRLSDMCKYFGIPTEPEPHRAINGAQKELEVLKKLLKT